jgi:hypothetical protein
MFQMAEFFITAVVKTSNPVEICCIEIRVCKLCADWFNVKANVETE